MKQRIQMLIVLLVGLFGFSSAQDGLLDTGFDTDGQLTTAVGSGDNGGYSVAIQTDGKIVVAGTSFNGSNYDFALVRYNIDGTLDAGFGTGGKVTTAIGSGDDVGSSVAIQADGKIVVAGYSHNGTNKDFAVVRYTSNGTLDFPFGGGGKVTTAIGSSDEEGYSVAVQADGKIVVAGYTNNGTNEDFALVRYTSAGVLDAGFGTGGKVTTAIGSSNERAYGVAIQADGNIVLAGWSHSPTKNDFAVVRYTSAGALDGGFGTGGKVTTAVGSGNDIGQGIAIQADGMIVVAGYSLNATYDFAAVRYTRAGEMDGGFGTGGKVTTAIGSSFDFGNSVAIQADGKIIVAGRSSNGSYDDFAAVRYTSAGVLDNTFDTDGKVTTSITGSSGASIQGVAIQANGMIVAAGYSYNGANDDFAVVRYTGSGTLNNTFDIDGQLTTAIGSSDDFGNSVAIQADGKIVVAGSSSNGTYYDFAVVRYNSDGSLDAGFGTGGKVTTAIGSFDEEGKSVAIQADGKIVVAGYSSNGTYKDFAVVRYNSNGTLDGGFGTGGKVTTPIGSFDEEGNSVAIQADGMIVVAGYSYNGSNNDFAVVRYTSAGALDAGFGTGGKVTTAIGSGNDYGYSVAIQSDGMIVVAGWSFNGTNNDFALVRYNTNGSLDGGFGTGGKVTTAVGSGNDIGRSVAIQGDGKIVVAGYALIGTYDVAAVRYTSAGALDAGFGTGGKVTTAVGTGADFGYSLAIQADGKIVVAGSSNNGTYDDFAAVRYTSAGALDNTFDSDGKVTTSIVGSSGAGAYGIAIQANGMIVVAGNSYNGSNNDLAVVRYTGSSAPLPVELTSFSVQSKGNEVVLLWKTATETNSYGFGVERKALPDPSLKGEEIKAWDRIGFVQGAGTTNAPKEYSFTEKNLLSGRFSYRLKQIDRDGQFSYSQEVEVTVGGAPKIFELLQNYPNPFNPSTTIQYSIVSSGVASVRVYDVLGREVAMLVNELQEAGTYSVRLDASKLSSGIYYCTLRSGSSISTKKMLLLK